MEAIAARPAQGGDFRIKKRRTQPPQDGVYETVKASVRQLLLFFQATVGSKVSRPIM
jgi:hypothetical protein